MCCCGDICLLERDPVPHQDSGPLLDSLRYFVEKSLHVGLVKHDNDQQEDGQIRLVMTCPITPVIREGGVSKRTNTSAISQATILEALRTLPILCLHLALGLMRFHTIDAPFLRVPSANARRSHGHQPAEKTDAEDQTRLSQKKGCVFSITLCARPHAGSR